VAGEKAPKVMKKYELCCLANLLFSYPETPWRVYVADVSSSGLVTGRWEVYAAESREEAKRWLERNCEDWVICDSP